MCADHKPGYVDGGRTGKILEIGCMGGKASFELAKYFDEVVGIDFTARLIQVGHR
jgi:2-polyprenyl-3-methyl-5-hydroxy-6-metoxy-1,4-benzoquinol methylase